MPLPLEIKSKIFSSEQYQSLLKEPNITYRKYEPKIVDFTPEELALLKTILNIQGTNYQPFEPLFPEEPTISSDDNLEPEARDPKRANFSSGGQPSKRANFRRTFLNHLTHTGDDPT